MHRSGCPACLGFERVRHVGQRYNNVAYAFEDVVIGGDVYDDTGATKGAITAFLAAAIESRNKVVASWYIGSTFSNNDKVAGKKPGCGSKCKRAFVVFSFALLPVSIGVVSKDGFGQPRKTCADSRVSSWSSFGGEEDIARVAVLVSGKDNCPSLHRACLLRGETFAEAVVNGDAVLFLEDGCLVDDGAGKNRRVRIFEVHLEEFLKCGTRVSSGGERSGFVSQEPIPAEQ